MNRLHNIRRKLSVAIFLLAITSICSIGECCVTDGECSETNFRTIPLEFDIESHLPVVKGKIDNQDARFLLDTGAAWTHIMPKSVKMFSLFSVPTESKSIGIGGASRRSIVRLKTLEFAHVKIKDPYIFELDDLGFKPSFDLILGADYLFSHTIVIDIKSSIARIYGDEACNPIAREGVNKKFFSIPAGNTEDDPRQKFTIKFAEQSFAAIIDTAATSSTVPIEIAKKIGFKEDEKKAFNRHEISGVGGSTYAVAFEIQGMKISSLTLPKIRFLVTKAATKEEWSSNTIILGLDFLRKYTVVFDTKNKRIVFLQ